MPSVPGDCIVDSHAKVVVIPVGVNCYLEPSESQISRGFRRFDNLAAVEHDLARLNLLFSSPPYRTNGFVVLPVISGTAGYINDRLNQIARDLATEPGRTALLFWSGHGDTPNGGELRLATEETFQPMSVADGLLPSELVNKLAASGARRFCLVLDVCQAGRAGASVAAAAANRFLENPGARFHGMAALFSAQAFEPAKEGLFGELFERILREGPSAEARARIAEQGFGGFTHNRLLTMDEFQSVIEVEFELLQQRRQDVQAPAGQSMGQKFGLFPNPLYQPDAPPLSVEVARRRWLRQQDLDTHFLPKARGLEPGEDGWFFSGRAAVSREIVEWLRGLGAVGSESLYVLTGSGGTGKSAIIGRIVALSDVGFRQSARAAEAFTEAETVPDVGSIDAALHLRNLDVAAAAAALSELLGIPAPGLDGIDAWLQVQPSGLPGNGHPVTVVLDALDEAAAPAEIAERLIQPLVARGWRLLIGSRSSAESRHAPRLLSRLGPAHFRDLDREPATKDDIAGYVNRRLTQTSGSPYAGASDDPDALAIADRIARKADGRFLFARLVVSGLLRRPRLALGELDEATGDTVGEMLARDLTVTDKEFRARFDRGDPGASTLLAALALAEGDGLPLRDDIWATVAGALRPQPQVPPFLPEHVKWLLREAGRYIIESGDGEQAVYRLFHESLNEYFRSEYDPAEACLRIAEALLHDVHERGGWDDANPYVVRYLPAYYRLPDAGLDRLCTDPWYLRRALNLFGADRFADMLGRVYRTHRSSPIDAVAKSVRRARVALSRDPSQLAAQLHARLAGEETGNIIALIYHLPRAAPQFWLRSRGATLGWKAALQTMQTFSGKVRAMAFGSIDGEDIIAVGTGAEVILWNPREGALPTRAIMNDGLQVTSLAIGVVDDREVLAVAAGYDGRLILRDARTGVAVGEPRGCASATVAIGKVKGRDCIAIPRASGHYIAWAVDSRGPAWKIPFEADSVGQLNGTLVAMVRRGMSSVFSVETGERIGKEIALPFGEIGTLAVGEFRGEPVLCFAGPRGMIHLIDISTGERLAPEIATDFPVRTLVVGEIDNDCIVAAGNDSDNETSYGYVAIRQPLTVERLSPPIARDLSQRRILGAGLAKQASRRARTLALVFDGVGAVDPLTWQVLGADPQTAGIELLSGAWQPTLAVPAPRPDQYWLDPGHSLRRDCPLEWPIKCEAWAPVGGRLLHARGSYFGSAWVIDAVNGEIIAGPFRSVEDEVHVRPNVKRGPGPDQPATSVSLGTWQGRGVIAIAHQGRADIFDLASANPLASPKTKSEILAVAVGEYDEYPLLATASSGGAVSIWEGPSMRRLASITLDAGTRGVWLAGNVVAVRTNDDRFHVFDLLSNGSNSHSL